MSKAILPFLAIAGAIALPACAPTPQSADAPAPEVPAAFSASEHYVDIDGARIRVREQGPEGAPVLVLLHGFTMSLESWDGWAERLDDRYRIVRYDLLGHGMTGPDPLHRYAPEERVQVLRELLNALGIERASFGGNSFGGLIAWRFAAEYPGRVDRLILVDSGAYSIYGVTDEPVPVPDAMRAYLRSVPQAAFDMSLAQIFADPSRLAPGRAQQMRAMMTRPGNGEAFIGHLEEFVLPEPTQALGRVAAPTLILWGEADAVIPLDHAARIAAAIPDARVITWPGVGHAPQEEIPAETAAAARAFLDNRQP
ncbi:alpha/beta fold hydrolase [Parasphingopyxis marina]|uniref:Alpha/beta hydrolase n=1 Tax=Parasphingopyxis marina TaxID=2761622 RepID=A0A842HUF5_9SPHN|nr:alpha/beta hydrolase [Parasphingopyxis marina]MBC2776565.1 alpha/beta hydrolase [Parasphingopyxis marina]